MESNLESAAPTVGAEDNDEYFDIAEELRTSREAMMGSLTGPKQQGAAPAQMLVQDAVPSPLRKFSLLGKADYLEARAADTTPLLGDFIMQGQASMIYAEPNTGKTLITMALSLSAIEDGRINPGNLFYFNADDSSKGIAEKGRLFQDVGTHMIVPGHNEFRTDDLVRLMIQAAETDTARGTCIIIDTLKKFIDLMDKRRSSDFAQVVRQFTMCGGTVVALGHTTKKPNSDGTPLFQGTTDIRDDFDSVYVARPLKSSRDPDQMVAEFIRIKSRADSPATVAYAFSAKSGLSYAGKLASVRWVSPDALDDYAPDDSESKHPAVIQAVTQLIEAGNGGGKMVLAKAAAKATGVSHRAAVAVVEKYSGEDPTKHLWTFDTRGRGAQFYRLLDRTAGDA